VKNLGKSADTTRGSLGTINNEIQKTATYASNTRGPLGTMSNEIANVGRNAAMAAGQVSALATAMSHLQNKTVTLTVNTVMTTTHRQHGGPVMAGMPYTVGEAGRELFVPDQSGIIIPAQQTSHILATASEAAAGSSTPVEMHVHSHAYLDGKEIFNSVRVEAYRFQTRNAGSRTGLLIPGNQIGKA